MIVFSIGALFLMRTNKEAHFYSEYLSYLSIISPIIYISFTIWTSPSKDSRLGLDNVLLCLELRGKALGNRYLMNAHQGQCSHSKTIKIKITTIIIRIQTTLTAKTTTDNRINNDKGFNSKDSSSQGSLSKE